MDISSNLEMHSTSTEVAITMVVDHAKRDHMEAKENTLKIIKPNLTKVMRVYPNPQRINL